MKYLNYSVLALLVFLGRLVIFGSSIPDAAIVAVLAILCGFRQWLSHNTVIAHNENFENEVKVELTKIKNVLGTINLGNTYSNGIPRIKNG